MQVAGGADDQQAVLHIQNTQDGRGKHHVSCAIDLSLRTRGIRKTSAYRMQV